MPWIDADFSADADSHGEINSTQRITAPASGKLKEYRVKTTTGCESRSHTASLTVTRSDNPGDTLAISVSIPDCTEVDNSIDPAYRVMSGHTYDLVLKVDGFAPAEHVEGSAGVLYSLFIELAKEV